MTMANAPSPRPALAALPVYKPGKSAEVAMKEHAIAEAIKLASNENPYNPLPSVQEAADRGVFGSNRYPDHRATAVRERLAARWGLTPDQVAVGCGSVGLLQQLLLTFVDAGQQVLYAWRTFESYPIYAQLVAAEIVTVPLRRQSLDLKALAAAVTPATRMVLVTSPNNPTGTAVRSDHFAALLDAVPEQCVVVLDEAYHEYITGHHVPDALSFLPGHPNLVVLRTFSKAYGLAAMRIGYAMAHPDVIASVDKTLIPFAVNGVAQAAALASLEPAADQELIARVEGTLAERERVAAEVRALGLSVPDPQANFVWLPAGESAAELTLTLEQLGVVTRPFPGEGVRVTIGSPAENDRFLSVLADAAGKLALTETWLLPTGVGAATVQRWVDRIDAAQSRLTLESAREHDGLTEPDPGGTERWDAAQVWAHLAEFGGYWRDELDKVIAAESDDPVPFGRVKTDARRIAGIEAGRALPVSEHVARARFDLDVLRAEIAGWSTADWGRVGQHQTLGNMTIERQLDEFHVGHVEQHLDQLAGLAPPGWVGFHGTSRGRTQRAARSARD